jgi:hypothetical protein
MYSDSPVFSTPFDWRRLTYPFVFKRLTIISSHNWFSVESSSSSFNFFSFLLKSSSSLSSSYFLRCSLSIVVWSSFSMSIECVHAPAPLYFKIFRKSPSSPFCFASWFSLFLKMHAYTLRKREMRKWAKEICLYSLNRRKEHEEMGRRGLTKWPVLGPTRSITLIWCRR